MRPIVSKPYHYGKKPLDPYGWLHELGIIRQAMVEKLFSIRNAIEHEDATPPSQESCKDFVEFAWYFLRSTDGLTTRVVDTFSLEHPDVLGFAGPGVEVHTGPDQAWVVHANGVVRPDTATTEERPGWIRVLAEIFHTREDEIAKSKIENRYMPGYHDGRQLDDMFFRGSVQGPGPHLRRIMQLYFAAV